MNRFLLIACLLVPMSAVGQKPDLGRNTTGMLPANRVVSAPQTGSKCLHDSADGLQISEAVGDCATTTGGTFNIQNIVSGGLNGALNASSCGAALPPLWCFGSEMGAWINAAVAQLGGCGAVSVSAGVYLPTTSVALPRCVDLGGDSAKSTDLHWASSTGCAIVVSDNLGDGKYPEGAIHDLTVSGPGSTACGIFIGGDPANVLSPSTNFADHTNLNRVRVWQFNVGVEIGNNTWSDSIFESIISNNVTGVLGVSTNNAGERLSISHSSVQNNSSYAINNNGLFAPGWGIKLTNSSIDYNGNGTVAPIQGGFVSESNHFEQLTGPFFDTTGASPGWVHDSGSFFLLTGVATPCFGKLTGGGLPQPNSFTGSTFWAAHANTDDILCSTTGATANFWGVTTLGAAVNHRGPNYFVGTLAQGEGQFGSQNTQGVGYCEGVTGITTLSTGATTTNTGISCLPAASIIDAVLYRITTTITTAVSFTIGDGSTAARFCSTQSVMTAGTTGVCLAHVGTTGQSQAAGAAIRVTTNANPGAGAIRLIVYYHTFTPPTS